MTKLVILGEAQGSNEARIGAGFVGASGVELLRQLDEAGILVLTAEDHDRISKFYNLGDPVQADMIWRMHPEVFRTNVIQRHPPGNKLEAFCGPRTEGIPGYGPLAKSKYLRAEFAPELERLGDELLEHDPNLILALGNTALWALCNQTGIASVRGTTMLTTHCVSGFKLLPTYHPAAVLRQWELRPTTIIDLLKARREMEYPEIRRPPREIWIEPTLTDLETFYAQHIVGARYLSVDIETSGTQITSISFAPSAGVSLVIPISDSRKSGRSYWPNRKSELIAWAFIRRVLASPKPPKIFQNGSYDMAFLWRGYGIPTYGAEHDTMLLHHALQPEALKGLGFLGSIYTDEGAWKRERKTETIKRDE